MFNRRLLVIFAVVAMLCLSGSQCVFIATSGDHHKDKEEDTNLLVVITEGRFVDDPVQGVRYVSGSLSGITGPDGEFQYEQGQPVSFFIGDIALGEANQGKAVLTPVDLVPDGSIDSPAVINIARLLQSLDSQPGDARITIPSTLRKAAVRSNSAITTSIRFLDFADDTAFVNAASQLIATLTAGYPFTAMLVDAESARQRLEISLAQY